MSLPVTIEVAKELEQNHGFRLGRTNENFIHYYHVFPNIRWAMAVTGRRNPKNDFLPLEVITTLMLLDDHLWGAYLTAEYGHSYLED